MKYLVLSIGLGMALAGGAAIAQDTQAPADAHAGHQVAAADQSTAQQAEEEDPRMQEVQCRTERVTGSRTRVNRTCMTRAEWRALEARSREDVNEMQGGAAGGYQCRVGPNGCSSS